MWHIALGSWHWIRQVAAPCSGRGLWVDMPWNSPKRQRYWNSTSGLEFDHITAVNMSFCTDLRNLSKSDHPQHKKMTSCQFSRWPFSAILDFKGPIMGSLKSPCTNSSRSSIDTVALNCLVFWENHIFLAFLRQIDKQTNEQMDTTDALSRSRYREQRLNKFAKNCCKRTVLVQVIIEDIVTFFFGRPCIYNYPTDFNQTWQAHITVNACCATTARL